MSPFDRTRFGLRNHLNRFSHTVVNVSDLDRAVEFYEATFPVRRRTRINGPAQAYPGLGISHGQFTGWVMESCEHGRAPGVVPAEFQSRVLHLIEWKTPRPVGTPYREANHRGIYRQNSLVSNIDAVYARVVAHNGRPYGEPSRIVLTPDGFGVTVFAFRDPDGSTLESIAADDPNGAPFKGVLHHCNLNVGNLERAYQFYRDSIGLDLAFYFAPTAPQPADAGSIGDLLRNPDGSVYAGDILLKATLLGLRTDNRTPIDVLEWTLPKPFGEAYPVANHLGIIRVAFEVDDLAAARAALIATGHVPVGPLETWDMGDYGTRRVVIFKDLDGIELELIEQPPYLGERPPFDP